MTDAPTMYELTPHLGSVKSFYGKAVVTEDGDRKILRSYDTDVALLEDHTLTILVAPSSSEWSGTTNRHLRDFAYQNGFGALTKSELAQFAV